MKRITLFLLGAFVGAMAVAAQAPQTESAKQTGPREYVLKQTLTGYTGRVVFSPDGQELAISSEDKEDKTVLWDVKSGAVVHTLTGLSSVAFSPDAHMLASSSSHDKAVKLWDVQTGTIVRTFTSHSKGGNSVAFSPDGRLLAAASVGDKVELWDVQTGALVRTLTANTESLLALAFSPDGRQLTATSFALEVSIWDVETGALVRQFGQKVRTLKSHPIDIAFAAAFSSDVHLLAVDSFRAGGVLVTDVASGIVVQTISDTNGAGTLCFSPDGLLLASGYDDGTVKVSDVQTGTLIQSLTGHTKKVISVAFSSSGLVLASSSADMTVKLWHRAE